MTKLLLSFVLFIFTSLLLFSYANSSIEVNELKVYKHQLQLVNNNNNNNNLTIEQHPIGEYQLQSLFAKLNSENIIYKLDLSEINLIEYPYNLTELYFGNISHLNLSNNEITSINDEIKIYSKNLTSLDLSSNKIKSISLNTFKNLLDLKYLNLKSNEIFDINLFSFELNVNLVQLDLSRNQLNDNSVQFLIFSNLKRLKKLDLGFNQLTKFNYFLIQNLVELENLVLKRNKLRQIDNIIFRYLKSIDLSFNEDLWFVSSSGSVNYELVLNSTNSLMDLNLAGVRMLSEQEQEKELLTILRQYNQLSSVLRLNLSDCNLQYLSDGFIGQFKQLEIIDLSRNQLVKIDCVYGQSLKLMNLFANKIDDLRKLTKCMDDSSVKIDLRYNQLRSLMAGNLHSKNVSMLLEGNPLQCDCDSNSWWGDHSINSTLFKIDDYEKLYCSFRINSTDVKKKLKDLKNSSLLTSTSPTILCSYKRSCSSLTCECCEFRACDCKYECPFNCECHRDMMHSMNIINCKMKNLTQIPFTLSTAATQLDLSQNSLKRLKSYQFFAKTKLTNLNLSFNEIGLIEENSFNSLLRLKYLFLNHNKLKILFGFEFKELQSLEYLDLSSNLIQFIALNTFNKMINLKYLNLNFNSLKHVIENRMYFRFNLQLDHYITDNRIIPIDHNITVDDTDTNASAELQAQVTNEPSLAYLYDIGMSTKLNLINNNNNNNSSSSSNNLDVFECTNRLFDKILLRNLTQFLEMFATESENASDSSSSTTSVTVNKELIHDFFLKLLLSVKQKCKITIESEKLAEMKAETSSVNYLKQEENYVVLNKLSFVFYIVLTIVFTLFISFIFIVVVLNLKKCQITGFIVKKIQVFKEKYLSTATHHQPLSTSDSTTSSTMSTDTNNYYYLCRNEKNIRKFTICGNSLKLNNKKLNYDLFLIYNKTDSEIAHNLIGPILKSKPYYYAIAMQHAIKSDDEIKYQDYIKSSSYVVFIIGKHLLSENEYKLVNKTPKSKRIAIIIDNLNEDIVKRLFKPKRIIKWQLFNFNNNNNKQQDDFIIKSFSINEKLYPFVDAANET